MAIAITGIGSLTCAGRNSEELFASARDGRSGLTRGLGYVADQLEGGPSNRSLQLAEIVARQAMTRAKWDRLNDDDGLILATTTGQVPVWNSALKEYLRGTVDRDFFTQAFKHQPLGDLLLRLDENLANRRSGSKEQKTRGPRLLVTSACSASTQALAIGAMWIRQGRAKRVLVGGIEVLCDLTINGFKSLQLLSEKATKPFDKFRSGINLAEGAGFLCLENKNSTTAECLARLSGYGITSDGYHMTAPHPEGRGCHEAMRLALKTANLATSDIDWVHAHGTGSTHNDLAEGIAIRMLFPDSSTRIPWVSSSKWVHGHTLGASGAIEAILCVEALHHQTILKTHGLQEPDETIRLNHPAENLHVPVKHILKNTLGFGGTNAALVLSAGDL